jgi:hypothetical protein
MNSKLLHRDRVWKVLYNAVVATMTQFGTESAVGDGDYWVIDYNDGLPRVSIDVFNFDLFSIAVIAELRKLLANIPDWEIILVLDLPKSGEEWPLMGVAIRQHEVVDGLQREYLPEDVRPPAIPGSRPGTGYD